MNRTRNTHSVIEKIRIHRVACVAIVFWVLIVPLHVNAQPALAVGSGQASCGQTITIPVTVSGAVNIDAFGMKLTYDTACLTYEGTQGGTATSNWASVNGNESTPGQVTLGGFKGSGTAVNGAGELLRVTLRFRTGTCPCQSALGLTALVDDLAGATVTPGTATSTATSGPAGRAWLIYGATGTAPTPTSTASPSPSVTATPNPTGSASPTPSPTPSPTGSASPTPTPSPSPTATPTGLVLSVGSGQASCGQTVEIPIAVSNAVNLDAFGMTLTFDAGCAEFVSASAGAATTSWAAANGNETTPGQVVLGGYKGSGSAVNGTGEVVRITLRCRAPSCACQSVLNLASLVDDVQGAAVVPGSVSCVEGPTPTVTPTATSGPSLTPTPTPSPSPSASSTPSPSPSPTPSATPSPTGVAQGEGVLVRQLFASSCEITQTATDLVSLGAEKVWLASELNSWQLTLTGTLTEVAGTGTWTYSPTPDNKLVVDYASEPSVEFAFATFTGDLDNTWLDFVDQHSLDFTAVIAGKVNHHIISNSTTDGFTVEWTRTIAGAELFDTAMMTVNLSTMGTRTGYSFYPETVYDYDETCSGTSSTTGVTITVSEQYFHAYNNNDVKQEKWIGWRITSNSTALKSGVPYRAVGAFAQWDMISITGSPFGVSDPLYWFSGGEMEKDGQPFGSVQFTHYPVMYTKGPDLILHTVDTRDLFLHTLIE